MFSGRNYRTAGENERIYSFELPLKPFDADIDAEYPCSVTPTGFFVLNPASLSR